MTIGERIRKYRKENEITQAKLAQLSGRSKSSIEKYEHGSVIPSIDAIKSIAKALNLEIDCLIDFKEPLYTQVNSIETINEEKIKKGLDIDNLAINLELHKHLSGEELEQIYHNLMIRECDIIQKKCDEEINNYKREAEFYKNLYNIEKEYRNKLQEALNNISESNNKLL